MKPKSYIKCLGYFFAILSLFLSACREEKSQRITIFAASSLTDVVQELKNNFESHHHPAKVGLVFAGSQILRLQIEHGAQADIFLSADLRHIQKLQTKKLVTAPFLFAFNRLSVIVPLKNSTNIKSFHDLIHAKRIVIGTRNVPAGKYTHEMLKKAERRYGIHFTQTLLHNVVSEEPSVRMVRTKIELNEADAGIVYRTDALNSRKVGIVPIPAEINVSASYYLANVVNGQNTKLIRKWLDFVRSEQVKKTLRRFGFEVK